MNWYVLHTRPRSEKKAEEQLLSLGINAYCPTRKEIKFWSSFDNFETEPLPKDKYEYLSYKSKLQDFVQARNQRILNSTINGE